MVHRKTDEAGKARFRTNRMFEENDAWYFYTREGDAVGPFVDELEATTQLEVYIRLADSGLLSETSRYVAGAMAVK